MGLQQLPDELLLLLAEQWPCRETQLKQLSAVLSARAPTVVAYGTHATGKSTILQAYLEATTTTHRHAIVQCRECVTGRHLLERIVAEVHDAVEGGDHDQTKVTADYNTRCENISALVVHLQRLLENRAHLVLVLDDIDKQRDAPPTLLPALARLGEIISNLAIILIVQHPAARFLHRPGVPHIHFSPYTRAQSLHIISRQPLPIFPASPSSNLNYDQDEHAEDQAWLWPRFCAAVWDSLGQNGARDLVSFQDVCHKLWPPFVAPIIKGDFGTRDFSRLLVSQRRLFQDESVLLDSIISQPTASTPALQPANKRTHELPYYAKWLLIAAYLASFTPTRLDALYFMKATERARRKKGGGTARPRGRPSQKHKVSRHLLAPAAFTLDRLLAILHAILPHDLRTTVDLYTQIATLTSLRLLVKGGGIGGVGGDALEAGGKWRVGAQVGWEFVLALARSVDFELRDYAGE